MAGLQVEGVEPSKGESPKTVIIMLGAPGSGKGTQAEKLQEAYHLPHISTGDLFRENMRQGTKIGKKAQEYINAGKLVPDDIVLDMLFERISKEDASKGYILDGFPRTIPQAKALDVRLGKGNKLIVIDLIISDDTALKRISGRRTCTKCAKVYNIYYNPPPKENTCECGGELVQRPDDKPEVVKERLKTYHTQTEPLEKYYKEKNVLFSIDGEKDLQTVLKEIKEKIDREIR